MMMTPPTHTDSRARGRGLDPRHPGYAVHHHPGLVPVIVLAK